MLYSPAFTPLLHGAAGILDELLLFFVPLLVVAIILIIASRRARRKAQPRERSTHTATSDQPEQPED